MKWIKKFESFVNDDNRGDETQYPQLNPVLKMEVTEYVEDKLKSNEFADILHVAGIKAPSDISSQELEELFDEAREKAITYYINNPEEMGKEVDYKSYKVNGGDGVARTNNIGGALRESREFDSEIKIAEDEMKRFSKEQSLQELIRNGKIALYDKKVKFNKSDKDTIETLDIYFEFDKDDFKSDNTNESKIGDFFRKKFNNDEETAMGILDSISDDIHITSNEAIDLNDREILTKMYNRKYTIDIDGFKVDSSHFSLYGDIYNLKVDDVKLKCSERTSKRIFKKLDDIYTAESKRLKAERMLDNEHIRKDAKIHFRKK